MNFRTSVPVKYGLAIAIIMMVLTPMIIHIAFLIKANGHQALNACQQVWAHRGLTTIEQENSISAFSSAFKHGATGVELDVHFHSESFQFIVSHDPVIDVVNSEVLTLEEVFTEFGDGHFYWLDFKNLYQLNPNERSRALEKLELLSQTVVSKSELLVESVDDRALSSFTQQGFQTSYWIALPNDLSQLSYLIHTFKIKVKYLLGQFTMISTDIVNYSSRFQIQLPTIPTLLFTVNDSATISSLFEKNNVRVVLTDLALYGTPQGCIDDNK